MLLNFSLSQLVLSSPSDVLCKVLPLSDSGCRIKVVLNNFCTAAVKLEVLSNQIKVSVRAKIDDSG